MIKMERVTVSVIIPVYNVEKYLCQCIESVINQTYNNLEIWLVDDGSEDLSGKICDSYAGEDSRINVIHKKNGGLSSARNSAIEKMTGEYVYFLDSDDYISHDLIEKYVELMEENHADVVLGNYYTFCNEVARVDKYEQKSEPFLVYSTKETLKLMLLDEKLHHAAAGPLYRSDLFKDIRFPEGLLYEDYATTYRVIVKCNKVVYSDKKRYFYRTRSGSIMNSKVNKEDMVLLDIADDVSQYIWKIYPELGVYAQRKVVVTALKLYSRILKIGFNAFSEEQKRIRKIVKDNIGLLLWAKDVRKIDKIKICACLLGKIPFYFIYECNDWYQTIRNKD